MVRILPALMLAVIIHTGLLSSDWYRVGGRDVKPPKASVVTVTMSYRQPQKPPAKTKKTIPKKQIRQKETKSVIKIKEELTSRLSEKNKNIEIEKPEETVTEAVDGKQDDTESIVSVIHDAMPLYHLNPHPVYPKQAKRRGYNGSVILMVQVNRNGRVADLWVFTSSGYMILDNAAINSVKNWVFEPGMKNNRTVEMWVKVPVRFELK